MTQPNELLKSNNEQLTEGNGRETQVTRGMTLREIVLEVREDVKELKEQAPTFVTRKELYGSLAAVSGFVFGLLQVIG